MKQKRYIKSRKIFHMVQRLKFSKINKKNDRAYQATVFQKIIKICWIPLQNFLILPYLENIYCNHNVYVFLLLSLDQEDCFQLLLCTDLHWGKWLLFLCCTHFFPHISRAFGKEEQQTRFSFSLQTNKNKFHFYYWIIWGLLVRTTINRPEIVVKRSGYCKISLPAENHGIFAFFISNFRWKFSEEFHIWTKWS